MNIQAPPNLHAGRAAAADRGRHQRLGRRLAGDARPRQSRGAVAAARGAGAGDRRGRQGAGGAAGGLSGLRAGPGPLARRRAVRRAVLRRDRRRRAGARRRRWRAGPRPRRPPRWLRSRARRGRGDDRRRVLDARRGAATSSPRTRSSRCSRRAATDFDACRDGRRRAAPRGRGDTVTYVVNRNINYTNICYFRCQFCAFSKGKLTREPARRALRSRPRRDRAAHAARPGSAAPPRSACRAASIPTTPARPISTSAARIKAARPDMHVHAFSPLEVWQGAATLGCRVAEFLAELKDAGLGTLPGTAAEILDDEVRAVICPDKITTAQWLAVMGAAHARRPAQRRPPSCSATSIGRCTGRATCCACATCRSAPAASPSSCRCRSCRMETPIYLKGRARPGPTFREAVLMHAVARLALHPLHHQHPDLVGQDGPRRRRGLPRRRRQRPRRHA